MGCILEVEAGPKGWQVVPGPYSRRISALKTTCGVGGPAAGHSRMKTPEDPQGIQIKGTFGNCSGGVTPWGTILIAEEKFQYYFGGDLQGYPKKNILLRYSVNGRAGIGSWRFFERFDMNKVGERIESFWLDGGIQTDRTPVTDLKNEQPWGVFVMKAQH